MRFGKLGEVKLTEDLIEKIIRDIGYNRNDWTSRILKSGVEGVQKKIFLLAGGKINNPAKVKLKKQKAKSEKPAKKK